MSNQPAENHCFFVCYCWRKRANSTRISRADQSECPCQRLSTLSGCGSSGLEEKGEVFTV